MKHRNFFLTFRSDNKHADINVGNSFTKRVFDEGTMWSIGSWYKYNPDDPKNPIRIRENTGDENKIVTLSLTEETRECGQPQYLLEIATQTEVAKQDL